MKLNNIVDGQNGTKSPIMESRKLLGDNSKLTYDGNKQRGSVDTLGKVSYVLKGEDKM